MDLQIWLLNGMLLSDLSGMDVRKLIADWIMVSNRYDVDAYLVFIW